MRQYRLTTELEGLHADTEELELAIKREVRKDNFERSEKLELELAEAKETELKVRQELAALHDQIEKASECLRKSFCVGNPEDLRALQGNMPVQKKNMRTSLRRPSPQLTYFFMMPNLKTSSGFMIDCAKIVP